MDVYIYICIYIYVYTGIVAFMDVLITRPESQKTPPGRDPRLRCEARPLQRPGLGPVRAAGPKSKLEAQRIFMSIKKYIYIYIYIYLYLYIFYIYIFVYISIYILTCIYIYIYGCFLFVLCSSRISPPRVPKPSTSLYFSHFTSKSPSIFGFLCFSCFFPTFQFQESENIVVWFWRRLNREQTLEKRTPMRARFAVWVLMGVRFLMIYECT